MNKMAASVSNNEPAAAVDTEKFDIDGEVEDIYKQLPPLPSPLPKQHKDFVHSNPKGEPQFRKFTVFTAGSIEMGKAVQWQNRMATMLSDLPITVCNPRKGQWNSAVTPEAKHQDFRDQVSWELAGLEQADVIIFFFDVATKSPVSLLELGLWAGSDRVIVCCNDKFWRQGNVKITCERYGVPMVGSFAELVPAVKDMLYAKGMRLDENGDLIGPNVHVRKEKPKKKAELEADKAELQREVASLRAQLAQFKV